MKDKNISGHLEILFSSLQPFLEQHILVPRGRAPFGLLQESRPLDRSSQSEIPVLIGFPNTIE